MYNIISIITIVLFVLILAAFVGVILFHAARKNRAKVVGIIKGFKFGKWAFVNILTIPLTTVGYIYEGYNVGMAIFRGITSSAKLITFGFDLNFKLMSVNNLFKAAIYMSYVLVVLNTLVFALSCLFQILWYWNRKQAFKNNLFCKRLNKKHEFCIIVGDNTNNKLIYNSRLRKIVKRKTVINKLGNKEDVVTYRYKWNYDTVLMDVLSKDRMTEELIANKIYIPAKSDDNVFEALKSNIEKFLIDNALLGADKKTFTLIINYENEKKSLDLTAKLVDVIAKYASATISRIESERGTKLKPEEYPNYLQDLVYLKILVYCSEDNLSIYDKFNKNSFGCVRLINKYTQVANDFVEKYPLSQYVAPYIDHETALIKDEHKDLDINVIFIGFGNTNKQIFLSMFPIAQFIKRGKQYVRKEINDLATNGNKSSDFVLKNGIVPQPVNYYIFDSSNTWDDKNLSHYYNRYAQEYLSKYSEEERRKKFWLDVQFSGRVKKTEKISTENIDFYDKLFPILMKSKKCVNYVIVSLGDDYETIDITNKISNKLNQWNAKNCHVFASVKDNNFAKAKHMYLDQPNAKNNNTCESFGSFTDVVYSYKKIVDKNWLNVGAAEDYVYNQQMAHKAFQVGWTIPAPARLSWSNRTTYQFKVSYFATRSIRHKLLLMGLDIKLKEDVTPSDQIVARTAYEEMYSKGFELKFIPEKDQPGYYRINYPSHTSYAEWKPSLRRNLAILEHSRWASIMITEGYIPMPKDHLEDNTEARDDRRLEHANICSYDDVWYYIQLGKKCGHIKLEKIAGDYKFLDNLGWYADSYGFAIIKSKI